MTRREGYPRGHCGRVPPSLPAVSRQSGAVLIAMTAALLVGLVLLLSADVGYMAYLKRDLQKQVDMAALAGAQRLARGDAAGNCSERVSQAVNDIVGTIAWEEVTLLAERCGNWNVKDGPKPVPVDLMATEINPNYWYFSENGAANAVRVTLVAQAPKIAPFPWSREVRAYATSVLEAPAAAFTVGSQLARTDPDSVVGRVLSQVGVSPQALTLVDWNGLANLRVTPAGLLGALGIPIAASLTVADFNALLAAQQVTIGDLIAATGEVVGQDQLLGLGVNQLLATPVPGSGLTLGQLRLTLGSNGTTQGLFSSVVAPDNDAQSALMTSLRLNDLLSTVVAVAGFDSRLSAHPSAVATNLFLTSGGVQAKARVVEPPQIGIGGVGTKAYNAQVRLSIDLDTRKIPLLNSVLALLGTYVHIPLHVDVVGGEAELVDLQCESTPPTASIAVTTRILHTCLGNLSEDQLFSSVSACSPPADGVLVRVFGQDVVEDVGQSVSGLVQHTSPPHLQFVVDEANPLPQTQVVPASTLPIGTTLVDISKLPFSLVDEVFTPAQQSEADIARELAKQYLVKPAGALATYQISETISRLRNGDAATGLPPLGGWIVSKAIPRACGALNLATCWDDGDVWEAFRYTVEGGGQGILGSVVGLVVTNCRSLLGLAFNSCVENNLGTFLQTYPGGLSQISQGNPLQSCSGLLCTLLAPLLQALAPLLNQLGSNIATAVTAITGVELGRTEVELLALGCYQARLVQ